MDEPRTINNVKSQRGSSFLLELTALPDLLPLWEEKRIMRRTRGPVSGAGGAVSSLGEAPVAILVHHSLRTVCVLVHTCPKAQ